LKEQKTLSDQEMTPIFFILDSSLPLMVIPDTQAHLNGHTILTFTYSIFLDTGTGNPLIARSKESTLHLEEITDPNYYVISLLSSPASYSHIRQMEKGN
jgi:hypothetical protein